MNGWLAAVLVAMLACVLQTGGATASPAAPVPSAIPSPPPAEWTWVAQSDTRSKRSRSRSQPDLDEADQLSPRQLDERQPTRAARPREATEQAAAARTQRPTGPARTIACNGVFGKDSSHTKLATRFDSGNVAFTEVDGPEGSRLMASVLFPNDPKRRLEVLWQDEAARTDTHLIVINGQSTWMAPKGIRLGLALAALEKLNGKPFKISGFDQANGGSVSDWQGGALDTLPGGCRLGIRLVPDAKATEAARNEVLGPEFTSNDAKIRAVRPIIAEIIIGY